MIHYCYLKIQVQLSLEIWLRMHLPFSYVINMLQLNNSFKSFGVRSKDQKGKAKNRLILRHIPHCFILLYLDFPSFKNLQCRANEMWRCRKRTVSIVAFLLLDKQSNIIFAVESIALAHALIVSLWPSWPGWASQNVCKEKSWPG